MKLVRAGFGYDVDLRSTCGSARGRVVRCADAEFLDRVECDIEPGIGFLRLFLDSAGVHAIEGEVAVVKRVAGESDRPLRAISIIDGTWSEQHQAGPIAAADRDFLDLGRIND